MFWTSSSPVIMIDLGQMWHSVSSKCSQSYKMDQIKYVQINPVSVLIQAWSKCKRHECASNYSVHGHQSNT